MKYFTKITNDHWVAKNQLHAEIKKYMRTEDCTMIPTIKDKDLFINRVRQVVANICAKHKRCNPVELRVWNPHNDGARHTVLVISGVSTMYIYEAKEVYP